VEHSKRVQPSDLEMLSDVIVTEVVFHQVIGEITTADGDRTFLEATFDLIARHAGEGVYEFVDPRSNRRVRVTVESFDA